MLAPFNLVCLHLIVCKHKSQTLVSLWPVVSKLFDGLERVTRAGLRRRPKKRVWGFNQACFNAEIKAFVSTGVEISPIAILTDYQKAK
jgi:hypothetical protein